MSNVSKIKELLIKISHYQKNMEKTRRIIHQMELLGKPTDVYRRNLTLLEMNIRSVQTELKKNTVK